MSLELHYWDYREKAFSVTPGARHRQLHITWSPRPFYGRYQPPRTTLFERAVAEGSSLQVKAMAQRMTGARTLPYFIQGAVTTWPIARRCVYTQVQTNSMLVG